MDEQTTTSQRNTTLLHKLHHQKRLVPDCQDEDGPRPTYIVDTPAQLMVWNDLRPVQHSSAFAAQEGEQEVKGVLSSPLPCRTR